MCYLIIHWYVNGKHVFVNLLNIYIYDQLVICTYFHSHEYVTQKRPSEWPKRRKGSQKGVVEKDSNKKDEEWEGQMWHRNGTRCPKGTVPLRRSTVHDVLRAKSLFDFGKKQRPVVSPNRRSDAPDVVSGNGHEVFFLLFLIHIFIAFGN